MSFPLFYRLHILFFAALFGAQFSSIAQNYPVKHFGPQDGLAHSNVYRIFQDKKGFLWFGTEAGLSCFNGKTFSSYKSTLSVSMNSITYIGETIDEEKVICTYSGDINIIKEDSINPLLIDQDTIINTIISGQVDGNKVWFIAKAGGLYYLQNGKIFKPKISNKTEQNIHFRKIFRLYSGELIFASNTGLFIYDSKLEVVPYLSSLIRQTVYNLFQTSDGDIWVGLSGEILRLRNGNVQAKYPTSTKNEISDFLVTREGNIWAAIPNLGIIVWEGAFETNVTSQLKLQNILVNDLFEDYDGNIWIATHGSGLYCVQTMHVLNYPVQEGKVNNYTTAITSYKGKVYVGSIGTVSVCDENGMHSVSLSNLDPTEYIYFIKIIEDKLFIGTPHGVIVKSIGSKNEYLIPTNGALAMCVIQKEVWISRYGDVGVLDGTDYRINKTIQAAKIGRINALVEGPKGILFLGGSKGLFSYDGKAVKLIFGGDKLSYAVNSLFCDRHNRLWACTSWGIVVIENGKIKRYTTKSGLRNNYISSIAEDATGDILVATLSGLDRFNGKSFVPVDDDLGLISNELLSLCIDKRQNIWLGAVNGVSCILKRIRIPKQPLRTYITAVHVGKNKTIFPNRIEVPFSDKSVRIDFAALSYPLSEKVEYRYTIKGLDTQWRHAYANVIELSALPPGKFIFMLEAKRQFGEWTMPVSFELYIPTPFWQQMWFIIIIIVFSIFCMYYFLKSAIHLGERKRKEQLAIKSKMIYLKQQALSALINPHFVFNCLNSIQIYIRRNEKEIANKYLVQFAQLIRITLDHAAQNFICLKDEIDRIELYLKLEKLRFSEKLSFSVCVDPSIEIAEIIIPNMVLQPFIENAVKHGVMAKSDGGIIKVSFEHNVSGVLKITIEDNGPGIESTKRSKAMNSTHRSLGMKLTNERLHLLEQLHNKIYSVDVKEIRDEKDDPLGTRVTLLFDIKKAESEESVADNF